MLASPLVGSRSSIAVAVTPAMTAPLLEDPEPCIDLLQGYRRNLSLKKGSYFIGEINAENLLEQISHVYRQALNSHRRLNDDPTLLVYSYELNPV